MVGRFDYWKHPRNDLELPADAAPAKGGTEDWVDSAVRFAGTPAVLKGRVPAAAPAAPAAAPAAAGLRTVRPADWIEVTLPARPAFGRNLKAKVTLKNLPADCIGKKLLFHWHWLKPNGWGGYVSHVYAAPKVSGDGDYEVELVNVPGQAPAEFSVHSFLVGISADDDIAHSIRRGDFTVDPSAAPASAASAPAGASYEFPMHVGTHGFAVEAVVSAKSGGTVAAALADGAGFALVLSPKDGRPAFRFAAKGETVTVTGSASAADGRFHHLLAEIDREAGKANLYVDGRLSGTRPFRSKGSASTGADLLVGKGLKGEIDFLRIAHGSLAESRTTIDELYAWEFAGPFLKGAAK